MQEYFGKLRDLNTALEQQTLTPKPIQTIKPSDKHDSGMGSSTSLSMTQAYDTSTGSIPAKTAPTNKENHFPDEIMSIMKNVKSSMGRYMQEMMRVVAKHLGGVEVTAYLGHIFSMGLNFQMSMWQLVMMDTVYLPTLTREHLCCETGMLQLFAEILPIITLCSIPPPPFPIVAPAPLASQNTSGASIGGSSLPLLPLTPGISSTPIGTELVNPAATPSSGETQPDALMSSQQKQLSRLSLKQLSYCSAPAIGAWEGINKAVVCIAPSRDVQKPNDLAALSITDEHCTVIQQC